MSSQRLPISASMGSNVNMSCGSPMAANGVPSSLLCSMPSLPMSGPMNGCNRWPAIWTTPPNTYQMNQFSYQSQAMQMMATNPFQAWPAMPGLVGTQMAPQFLMNGVNGGRNHSNGPSMQRFPNNCDKQTTHCPQSQSGTKSFDVYNSHSKNNHMNASQSHSNYKSNQRNDRNTVNNHNNSYKRDVNHKSNNRSNHSHNSSLSKLKYKPSKRNSDSRGYYQDIHKGKDYEPESKRKRFSSSKASEETKTYSESSDKYNDSSTKPSSKREPTVDAEQIFTKPVEWLRCSPAELFYQTQRENPESAVATKRLIDLRERFRYELLERSQRTLESKPKFVFPPRVIRLKPPKTSRFSRFFPLFINVFAQFLPMTPLVVKVKAMMTIVKTPRTKSCNARRHTRLGCMKSSGTMILERLVLHSSLFLEWTPR